MIFEPKATLVFLYFLKVEGLDNSTFVFLTKQNQVTLLQFMPPFTLRRSAKEEKVTSIHSPGEIFIQLGLRPSPIFIAIPNYSCTAAIGFSSINQSI
jgi:hypothetical protein